MLRSRPQLSSAAGTLGILLVTVVTFTRPSLALAEPITFTFTGFVTVNTTSTIDATRVWGSYTFDSDATRIDNPYSDEWVSTGAPFGVRLNLDTGHTFD